MIPIAAQLTETVFRPPLQCEWSTSKFTKTNPKLKFELNFLKNSFDRLSSLESFGVFLLCVYWRRENKWKTQFSKIEISIYIYDIHIYERSRNFFILIVNQKFLIRPYFYIYYVVTLIPKSINVSKTRKSQRYYRSGELSNIL